MITLERLRLLQIASQALPIGGYSHSHGFEAAIECGLIRNEASVQQWIMDVLLFSMSSYELPNLIKMGDAWSGDDFDALRRLNQEFLASRETAELRSATVQMGFSLRTLLAALSNMPDALFNALQMIEEPSLPCVWSAAATAWSIESSDSAAAYLWSWAENQVLVAVKSLPLGQSAGQRVLLNIGEQIARLVPQRSSDAERSNFAPGLAILSSQHETQYSRLFRS
jgi:urease accessory protein